MFLFTNINRPTSNISVAQIVELCYNNNRSHVVQRKGVTTMQAKTYKTEVVQTRITPADKMKIMQKVNLGQFSSQTDFFNTALNLLIKDNSNLFANISREFNTEYSINTKKQYEQLKNAYDSLKSAFNSLTGLTDNYKQGAPNELKDVLRDYLLPRITETLKAYEDKKHISLAERQTEPDNLEDY